MPRVLNIEQLETKFSSLTRARESIINLSSWILHHSEFGDDIVDEWLAGLSKGFNALVMFYVANDVIMNCGKKRVPQFRTMFSKVLKKAMALSTVKEISKDILRVLKIWQDRGIYTEEFCEDLLSKLNEKVEIIPDEPAIEEEKEETVDIIKTYKKEHLFDTFSKLKTIAEEVSEKEEILKYAEEPVMPRLQGLGSEDCQDFLSKISRYYATLKGLIRQSEDELAARNNVLKELNNSSIFYSSQNEDVKKVAHAYKIYGKKIKNVAKSLSAKIETLPASENAAYFSDNDISSPKSPYDGFSPMDDSSECDSVPNTPESANNTSSLNSDKKIDVTSSTSSNRKLDQSSKLFQIWNEEQGNTSVKVSSTNADNEMLETEHSFFENSDFSNELFNSSCKANDNSKPSAPIKKDSLKTGKKLISSKESKNKIEKHGEKTLSKIVETIIHKKEYDQSVCKTTENKNLQAEKIALVETIDNSKPITSQNTVINEDSMSQDSTTKVEVVMKTIQDGTKEDLEEIDQLLEKTLKRENIKRKIEMLLKSKNKKHCPDIEEKQKLEKSPLNIPDLQQTTASKLCRESNLETSSQDNGQIISENVSSVSDISSKEPLKTTVTINSELINKVSSFLTDTLPENFGTNKTIVTENALPVSDIPSTELFQTNVIIDSELINKVSSFLNNSSPDNMGKDKPSKEHSIKDPEKTLNSLTNDSAMVFNSVKNQSESCTNPVNEQMLTETSKKADIKNITLNQDTTLLGSLLSNEVLKDILSKQKEISELSGREKADGKNSIEKCEEEKSSLSTFPDLFFATVFQSTTNKKDNLIPGLETLEELKPQTDSNLHLIENSENLLQTDKENTIKDEKKENANSSNLKLSEEKSKEEHNNSLSSNELTIKNDSSLQDSCLEEVKKKSNDTKENSDCNHSPVASDSLKIKTDSIIIQSKEHSGNKVEVNEMDKTNNSKSLIQTISGILECLSRNKSHLQKESLNFTKHKSMEISLENCCLIYGALLNRNATSQTQLAMQDKLMNKTNSSLNYQSQDVTTSNSKVDFCTTTNVLHRPISSTFEHSNTLPGNPSNGIKTGFPIPYVSEDNFQVADMDCDSE